MTSILSPSLIFQGLGFGGIPLPGGQLSSFVAGTSTPQATYTDSTMSTPNTNPVILNANGQAPVWLNPSLVYKFVLQDRFGNQIFSADQVQGSLTASALTPLLNAATLNQTATGFFYAQSGAKAQRFNDRVFVGDATANDGQGPTNPVSADWLSLYQQSLGIPFGTVTSSQFACLATTAAAAVTSPIGGVFGAQTLHTTQNAQNAVGVESYGINNSTQFTNNTWAFYGEGHRVNSTVNSALCAEFDVTQRGASVGISPYAQNFGQTIALQLASGAQQGAEATATFATNVMTITLINLAADTGLIQTGWNVSGVGIPAGTTITSFGTGTGGTGTYILSTSPGTLSSRIVAVSPMFDNTAAINIQGNPNGFTTGINFGFNAITGSDGVNGSLPVPAICFAKNHGMFWFASGGIGTSSIYCTAIATAGAPVVALGQDNLKILEASTDGTNFQVSITDSAVNFPFVQGATTGNAAVIGALGGDTNVDLGIFCAGSGLVKFQGGSMMSANGSVATVLGSLGPSGSHTTVQEWLTVKDAASNVRFIPCF